MTSRLGTGKSLNFFLQCSAKICHLHRRELNGTLVEDKMRRFKCECAHFSFNKFPIYIHDAVQVPNLALTHTTENSVGGNCRNYSIVVARYILKPSLSTYVNTRLNRAHIL
jgi:hypothetical protein